MYEEPKILSAMAAAMLTTIVLMAVNLILPFGALAPAAAI